MKRRAFLAGSGIAISTALAGCSSGSSTPDPAIKNIADDGTALTVAVENAQYADRVTFDVEGGNVSEKAVSAESPTASYNLGDPETLGTKQQQLEHQAEIEVNLFKQDGSLAATDDWTFEPKLELTDIVHSSEFEFNPQEYAQPATPVFEITNTGSGPARIDQLVVLSIDQVVPLKNSSKRTGFAHTVIAANPRDDRIQPVDTTGDHEFLIGGGDSAYFAAKGLFTHSGEPPASVESVTQQFDVEIRWLFGERRYRVETKLTDGIQKSAGAEKYRFGDYELAGIDYASPLR